MTYAEYEQRSNEINAWAKAQYDNGKHSENWIELQVERMFDKLDDEYMPSRHAGFTGTQYYSDFIEG
jgi:hypothetical protein